MGIGSARVGCNSSVSALRDYYALLGVARTASPRDIKKAFRQRALESHPDRNSGDLHAEARFKEINTAYETLRDPRKRQQYNRSIMPETPPAPPQSAARAAPSPPHASTLENLFQAFSEYDVGFSLLPYNGCALFFLILIFESTYRAEYFTVFRQSYLERSTPIMGFFHFMFYIFWLLFFSSWHWFFLLATAVMIMLFVRGAHSMCGWVVFVVQIYFAASLWADPHMIRNFVVYYEPLFTIAPLQPNL